ncbi:O-antigen translocase [Thauera sinica]|uniref:O-antigen translocase n=1 Tax=Thauera sinica TaxID=2665146 RepID=A0ABW1APE9_9RHOO|nr:O-antigen translocase [Thauera sp. K11]
MKLKSAAHFLSSTLVKIVAGLVVIKVVAWKLGPEGFGLLSQVMTVVAITAMLAGAGVTNGLIKVLAGAPANTVEGKAWVSTAFTVTTLASAIIALLLIIFSEMLANRLLQGHLSSVFLGLALAQSVVAYGNLVQAEASSRGDSAFYAKTNILGTVLGAGIIAAAVHMSGFEGAAYGVMLMPALPGLLGFCYALKKNSEFFRHLGWSVDKSRIRHLLSFSIVTLIGATSIPIAHLIIRDVVGRQSGWDQVGLWQGAVKISDVYMQFVGVVLVNYALPRCAAATNLDRAVVELKTTLLWLLLAISAGLLLLYLIRNIVIELVFSKDFLPMSDFFAAQFIGDIFRTVAASISFMFMARGIIRVSMMFELLQGVFLVVAFMLLANVAGRLAPVYAHVMTYGVLAIMMSLGLMAWVKRNQR